MTTSRARGVNRHYGHARRHGFDQHHALRLAPRSEGEDVHGVVRVHEWLTLQRAHEVQPALETRRVKDLPQDFFRRSAAYNQEVRPAVPLEKFGDRLRQERQILLRR